MSVQVVERKHVDAQLPSVWARLNQLDMQAMLGDQVKASALQGDKTATEIGSIRAVEFADGTNATYELLEISELEHKITWKLVTATPAPLFVGRTDSVQLFRVTESNTTVVEWTGKAESESAEGAVHASVVDALAALVSIAPAASPATQEWTATTIRQAFVDFFVQQQGHVFHRSSPVVPLSDPTLLFANAGMNQFKPLFLGQADPKGPLGGMTRATNSQKCIRAGGKHNDLDDVGKDVYHHTFFEMLGNWSFGDYFKEEAIGWAWELLTQVFGLDPERLYATYFGGDEKDGVPADDEARQIWLKYLPAERILPFDKTDNFWEMGDVGPCGPCTEIHYDRIGNRDAAHIVNMDDPDVLEIWNLVFMQFTREPSGELKSLPAKHVDTGMGFERLASILQGKTSNYDTDIFMPIFAAIQAVTGCPDYRGRVGKADDDGVDMAYRVVADHIRTLTFAITDGAVPSNEGRGYVLRRILRRAVRYGRQKLGAKPGFFHTLVATVVEHFKEAFPELERKFGFVVEVIADEEASFGRTLNKGIKTFNAEAEKLEAAGQSVVPGSLAFFLYDSMGFPLDLTQIMAEERNMTVDTPGYDAAMQAARERSAASSKFKTLGTRLTLEAEQTVHLTSTGVPVTVSDAKYDWHKNPKATVLELYTTDGFVEGIEAGDNIVGLLLTASPFYYESGGQVADTGRITAGDAVFDVKDVQAFAGYVLHIGTMDTGALAKGAEVKCEVDYKRRSQVAPNHTMTHVLNFALREVLGTETDQKGSLVTEEKLRFDFNSTRSMTEEELQRVEAIVNAQIDQAMPVHTKVVPLAAAQRINSLRAVFGEQYPDPVRVVSVGSDVDALIADPENTAWSALSIEFCGGTHLSNTAQAKFFALVEEGSIAKGIRRVVGLTGEAANIAHETGEALAGRVEDIKHLHGHELTAHCRALTEDINVAVMSAALKMKLRVLVDELEKRAFREKQEAEKEAADKLSSVLSERAAAAVAGGEKGVVQVVAAGANTKLLKACALAFRSVAPDVVLVLIDADAASGKLMYMADVPKALAVKGKSASDAVKHIGAACGGKGGGRPIQAQGVSKNVDGADAAIAAAQEFVAATY